jgi:hypothetical protein
MDQIVRRKTIRMIRMGRQGKSIVSSHILHEMKR